MKILLFVSLFFGMAYGQDACVSESAELCSMVDEKLDYHQKFYSALSEGFQESLKDSEMKDFIVRNFRRHRGELVVDTSFDRDGWFVWYRRILYKHQVASCEDLKKFEADEKLVQGCNEVLNKFLYKELPSDARRRVQKILSKVKEGIKAAYRSTAHEALVKQTLDSILDTPVISLGLDKITPEFKRVEEVCRESTLLLECMIYGESNKLVFSAGGSVYVSNAALESIIAQAVAERVAMALHNRLEDARFDLFAGLFSEIVEESHFEKIISKIKLLAPLNVSANTFLVLREYFSDQRKYARELLQIKVGYFCYEDKLTAQKTPLTQSKFYSKNFSTVHRVDKAAMLLCDESPLESEATSSAYAHHFGWGG